MKRLALVFFVLFFSFSIYSQENSNNSKSKIFRFGYGMNISLESLNQGTAASIGSSKIGITWIDLYAAINIIEHINISVGYSFSSFKDQMPVTQSVSSSSLWNIPYDAESKFLSSSYYFQGGVGIPVISDWNVMGNFGYRGFSSSRYIPDCDNCDYWDAANDKSTYLQAGIGWCTDLGTGRAQIKLLYSYYINSIFDYSITLGYTLLW